MDTLNEETIPINLWIAGRGYRIRINKKDEEKIRFAAKAADMRITQLKQTFAGKDDQDFVAMCLLMYAADQALEGNFLNTFQKDHVSRSIKEIDDILKKHHK